MADVIQTQDRGSVRIVTVNRPERRNALNRATLEALDEVLRLAAGDLPDALVVTGAGEKAFVAGADISEIQEQAGRGGGAGFARFGQAVFRRLERLPVPTVAAIGGYALGGGLELAMACDFRVALASARLGQPEINLGIIPGYGGTQRLQRLTGRSFALRLILSGESVDAEEALRAGLVDAVVETDVLEAAIGFLKPFLGKSRSALAAAKSAVDMGYGQPLGEAMEIEANCFDEALASPDAGEGSRAFLEKRAPDFRRR